MYRNAKNVGYYMIGKGALSQLGDILTPLRARHENGPAIFFLDHCFKDGTLADRLPVESADQVIYVNTAQEPTTESVDDYAAQVRTFLDGKTPAALLAFGGGSTLDTCKCVGNLLTTRARPRSIRVGSWSNIPRPIKSPCPPCPARARKPRARVLSAMRQKISSWA